MIPILYEANETAFTTQGLGALADAVSVSVSRVINGKDELTMVYPSTGARYADILNDRIIYAVPEYKKAAQPYQIYKITKPLNGMITVYARHVGSHRPGYIPVTPFTAGSLTETMNSLPNHLAESSPFTFWTNKTVTADFKLSRPASLGKVLGGMDGSILDVYGGEYEFDGYTIKLWQRRGTDSGVELRYAKNITDIEQSEDFASIITGVVPYWEGMDGTVVSLPEVVVEGQYADTYSFRRTIVKDFTESFDEEPTVADLRAAAVNYVSQSNLGVPEINLKVSFEHLAQYSGYENLQLLEKLNLGDTVRIFYEPLNVSATARIAKTTFDCLNEKYNSVQIGSVRSDLEQIMHTVSTNAAQMKQALQQNIPSALAEAVENATDLITGANGGYVVLDRDANGKPFQILIMDTDDKATATNVLRLNQNGIGFSTSGYSGPFSTAWTIDSNFVADFITTGTLNAALAKIGVLSDAAGKNSWNMVTGAFSITNGSIQINTNSETNDYIGLDYISPANTRFRTGISASGISVQQWQNYDPLQMVTDTEVSIMGSSIIVGYSHYQLPNDTAWYGSPVTRLGRNWLYFPRVDTSTTPPTMTPWLELSGNMIQLYDNAGTRRQFLTGNGTLWQYDANGKTRTYLEYGDIYLYNSSEKQTVHLGTYNNQHGYIYLYDGTSNTLRAWLDYSGLKFADSSGTQRVQLEQGGLSFYNSSGTTRQKVDENGVIEQYDTSGVRRSRLSWGDLYLYDANGVRTVHADDASAMWLERASDNNAAYYITDTAATTRARLAMEGLRFYDANNKWTAHYPAALFDNATVGGVTPYSGRCTLLGGAYRIGNLVMVCIQLYASHTATNTPRMATIGFEAAMDCPLTCIDITNGIGSAIEESIPCGVSYQGYLFMKKVTNGHTYAITGVYPYYTS